MLVNQTIQCPRCIFMYIKESIFGHIAFNFQDNNETIKLISLLSSKDNHEN